MENIYEIIQKRYSVRTYDEERTIEKEKLQLLSDYLVTNEVGPFGNKVVCKIIDASEASAAEIKQYVSYGNVKGARLYLAGSVAKGPYAMEDFGYVMEKNVLMATSLGLGTVWLAGSLNRGTFANKLGISDKEVIPAITPIGYIAKKRTLMDKAIRTLSRGKNRKPFGDLFFLDNLSKPLEVTACNGFEKALEAVRLAPSASNKQPWRVIKENGKDVFHFYMKKTAGYDSIKDIAIQNNDIGIGMSHFELVANELGLKGSWQRVYPDDQGDLVYITSWIA